MTDEPIILTVDADTRAISGKLSELESSAQAFGSALTSAFRSSIAGGKDLEQVMRKLALSLSNIALKAALAPLERSLQSALGGLFSGLVGTAFQAPTNVRAFAQGGIVSSPTFFPMPGRGASGEIGLMGEAGAEAILPLSRGADGKLGVQTNGNGASRPIQITFNVNTPDVQGFARSEAQVTAMLARAVGRGRRGI